MDISLYIFHRLYSIIYEIGVNKFGESPCRGLVCGTPTNLRPENLKSGAMATVVTGHPPKPNQLLDLLGVNVF